MSISKPRLAGITWLLRDDFNDTRAAGSVNGTPATPGPGTRVAVENNGGTIAIGGGNVELNGGGSSYNDANLSWDVTVSRVFGRLAIFEVIDANNQVGGYYGFDGDQNANYNDTNWISAGNIFRAHNVNVFGAGPSVVDGDYLAIVLRSSGGYFFRKIDGAGDWILVWHVTSGSDDPLYFGFTDYSAASDNFGFVRIPDELFTNIIPLAYDTFTGTNGTSLDAHTSDTSGPDSQTVTGRSWTEVVGDWDIQSNEANPDGAAIATCDPGDADVVVDLTVNGGTGGQPGIVLRYKDSNNYWYLQADRANNQLELHEVNGGVDTVRANTAVTINDSTDYNLRAICDGQTIDGYLNGGSKITYSSAVLNETETLHGLYADHAECEFDGFLVFARDGYSDLDRYIE